MKRVFLFFTGIICAMPAGIAGGEVMQSSPLPLEDPRLIDPQTLGVTLSHGRKTREVYVLLHGLTNCPPQFRRLADLLYRSGANVVIPRFPFHGYRDRMTDAHQNLSAPLLISTAEAALAQARPLGRKVNVIGFSAGGVTAAWVAQNRSDVNQVMLLAPFFSIGFLPDWMALPTRDLFSTLPNAFIWWDPRQGRNLKGSPFAYPRFSTRAVSQLIELGARVFADARREAPRARKIEILVNPADLAVNNARTAALRKLWERRAPGTVKFRSLPAEWKLPHDFVDPWHPDQRIDQIYPIILRQLGIQP